MKCGEFWYEGTRETQLLEVAEISKTADSSEDEKWKEISREVRKKCIATSKTL